MACATTGPAMSGLVDTGGTGALFNPQTRGALHLWLVAAGAVLCLLLYLSPTCALPARPRMLLLLVR